MHDSHLQFTAFQIALSSNSVLESGPQNKVSSDTKFDYESRMLTFMHSPETLLSTFNKIHQPESQLNMVIVVNLGTVGIGKQLEN